ncbi:DNA damage-induced apoptosis suppressor protein [Antennarius striatus]|uniref:DNA damage-induced apoptosis suppressor protein n=1 Tax=Antennarius striatus TaxID=241820 RepID=UPI0035B3B344
MEHNKMVDCVVLSLQDTCVFYPCCKGCFSRMDAENQDSRCRCSRCGYHCVRDLLEYRYRLSLRVTRGGSLFGVTVFGACLNPFFGIDASALQRLVENYDGPVEASTRSTLLITAVKDCFIGRRFIFSIKVSEKENWPWLSSPVVNESSRKDRAQLIATKMILPKAPGLAGCTIVSYYQGLLQKAVERERGSNSRSPSTSLLLIARHSPASSFNSGTLCSSGLSPQPLLRFHDQDCSLTHTPPWQQSLGLVTSSAEQEDSSCVQDIRDETSREVDRVKTPRCTQGVCCEHHEVTETSMVLSPLLPLELNSYCHPLIARQPHSSFEKAFSNTPVFNTCLSPTTSGHNCSKTERSSTTQLSKSFLLSSVAWEDLPFSESLTAYSCEENKHFGNCGGTELNQNELETMRNDLEIRSHDKLSSLQSTPVCQRNAQLTDRSSQMLPDVTNKPALTGDGKHPSSAPIHQSPAGSVIQSPARSTSFHECDEEDERVGFLPSGNAEEQLEGDFDCSADLFSGSLMVDIPNTINTHAQAIRSERTDVLPSSTHKHKTRKCIKRLIPPDAQEVNFVPPSQSTPIVKLATVSGYPASSTKRFASDELCSHPDGQDSSAFHRKLSELDTKVSTRVTCSLDELNYSDANQVCLADPEKKRKVCTTSRRHSHRFTPKRRSWKPNKHKKHLMTQQHLCVQREALNTGSTGGTETDSRECDHKDREEIIVPPTPDAVACQNVRRRNQTDKNGSYVGSTCKGRGGDGVHCKRTLMDQIHMSSQRPALTGSCDSESVDEEILDGSNRCLLDNEHEAGDWSRDLFSDSM